MLSGSHSDTAVREVVISYHPDRRGFPYREGIRGSIIAGVLFMLVAATVGLVTLIAQVWFPDMGAIAAAVTFFIIFVLMSTLGIMACLKIDRRKAMNVSWYGPKNATALNQGLTTAGYSLNDTAAKGDVNSLSNKVLIEDATGQKFLVRKTRSSGEGFVMVLKKSKV